MTKDDFLEKLSEDLEFDENLQVNDVLVDLDDWDSIAVMVTIAFVSQNFGIQLTGQDFEEITTVEDLLKKVGIF